MNSEIDELKKENEELLFQNEVLKVQNSFMKDNIYRMQEQINILTMKKPSIIKRGINKINRTIKKGKKNNE